MRQLGLAVRWVTERAVARGILDPSTIIPMHNKTVFDVLKENHPEPREASVKVFLPCDKLPLLIDVDVTAAQVEMVTHQIYGGAGPGGTLAVHWKDFLLR